MCMYVCMCVRSYSHAKTGFVIHETFPETRRCILLEGGVGRGGLRLACLLERGKGKGDGPGLTKVGLEKGGVM